MGTNVHLTPELERFAQSCVENGRFNNVSEVVRSGLRLLQDTEARRSAFVASLEEAVAEGDRDEFFTAEEVFKRGMAVIGKARLSGWAAMYSRRERRMNWTPHWLGFQTKARNPPRRCFRPRWPQQSESAKILILHDRLYPWPLPGSGSGRFEAFRICSSSMPCMIRR